MKTATLNCATSNCNFYLYLGFTYCNKFNNPDLIHRIRWIKVIGSNDFLTSVKFRINPGFASQ